MKNTKNKKKSHSIIDQSAESCCPSFWVSKWLIRREGPGLSDLQGQGAKDPIPSQWTLVLQTLPLEITYLRDLWGRACI